MAFRATLVLQVSLSCLHPRPLLVLEQNLRGTPELLSQLASEFTFLLEKNSMLYVVIQVQQCSLRSRVTCVKHATDGQESAAPKLQS